jgi:glycosyltransferase involved in cell wall biosynthesis
LLKAPEFSDFYLVIVGPDLEIDYPGLAKKLGILNRIRYLERVDDETLAKLYSGATALIFPSRFEGFGWPVIEAQACACPTFTADLSPMKDIGGTQNTVITLSNASTAAETIRQRICEGRIEKEGLLENAQRYQRAPLVESWLRAIRKSD